VVLSHAHWDQVQNADLFAAAAILVHADELDYCESPRLEDFTTPPWTPSLFERIGVRTVGNDEAIGTGVHTLRLPGHTAGSLGLAVETSDGLHVLTGDAVSGATNLSRRLC
jgi:glyoxylase-like metal-dependent hydrolase (beta-lactamase superfamily II)